MEELIKILSVVVLSAFKLMMGVPFALFAYGYSFVETVIMTSFGGILGVIVFTYFSEWILKIWKRFIKKTSTGLPGKKKQIFNRRNRLIVKIKRKYGIMGIAFISPSLITIPIGTFILVRYFHNKKKIIVYESAAVVFWSALVASVKLFFPELFDFLK